MREIVLDTETTGLNPKDGHRIIEIGAVELLNHMPTGRTFHIYINPERNIDKEAIAIHGINNERVRDEPKFKEIAKEFLDFIGDSRLIIHNASFDMSFLNSELLMCGQEKLTNNEIIDTLSMARSKFYGAPASLDALCKRFNVNKEQRTLHGALIDATLLSEVYIELIGGKQRGLSFYDNDSLNKKKITTNKQNSKEEISKIVKRQFYPSKDEIQKHKEFVKDIKNTIWKQYY